MIDVCLPTGQIVTWYLPGRKIVPQTVWSEAAPRLREGSEAGLKSEHRPPSRASPGPSKQAALRRLGSAACLDVSPSRGGSVGDRRKHICIYVNILSQPVYGELLHDYRASSIDPTSSSARHGSTFKRAARVPALTRSTLRQKDRLETMDCKILTVS